MVSVVRTTDSYLIPARITDKLMMKMYKLVRKSTAAASMEASIQGIVRKDVETRDTRLTDKK